MWKEQRILWYVTVREDVAVIVDYFSLLASTFCRLSRWRQICMNKKAQKSLLYSSRGKMATWLLFPLSKQ